MSLLYVVQHMLHQHKVLLGALCVAVKQVAQNQVLSQGRFEEVQIQDVALGSNNACQHLKKTRGGEHLACICDFKSSGSAHLHSGSLRWTVSHQRRKRVGRGRANSPSSRAAHTHTHRMHGCLHTHFSHGPASKSSFPKGLIVPSAQYGKGISRPWQERRASFDSLSLLQFLQHRYASC